MGKHSSDKRAAQSGYVGKRTKTTKMDTSGKATDSRLRTPGFLTAWLNRKNK